MKQKLLLILFVLAVITAQAEAQTPNGYWTEYAEAFDDSGGKGMSESNPIEIQSPEHLAYLAKQVNEEGKPYAGTYFKVTAGARFDLSPHYWVPIGKEYDNSFRAISMETIVRFPVCISAGEVPTPTLIPGFSVISQPGTAKPYPSVT